MAAALALLASGPICSQSLTGTEGLLTIPTARMHEDGTLVLGAGYIDRTYSTYQNGRSDYTPLYASVTFLPSVELGFRFSRALGPAGTQALGDRMFLARVRLLEEGASFPAIAVGAHDFLRSSSQRTNFFHALYAVASKRLGTPVGESLDVHVGWGTDLIDAPGYQFVGPFGGAALSLLEDEASAIRDLSLLAEYDGRTVAAGVRVRILGGIVLSGGVQGLDAPIFGAAYTASL